MKDTFIFNAKWRDAIRNFSPEVRLEIYEAIMDYATKGEELELSDIAKGFFVMVKMDIDKSTTKYQEICDKRRVAGRKGGLAGGVSEGNQNTSKMKQNKHLLSNASKCKQNKHDNEYDNDNELLLPYGNMSNNNLRSVTTSSSTSEEVDAEEELDNKRNDLKNKANAIVDYYNERIKAEGAKLRLCEARTDTRLGFIIARLKDYGEEKVKNVVDKAVLSHALNYDLRIAPVDIEWIMRPNNFPKVMEGAYNNREPQSSRSREYDLVHFEGENDPDVYRRMKEELKQQ